MGERKPRVVGQATNKPPMQDSTVIHFKSNVDGPFSSSPVGPKKVAIFFCLFQSALNLTPDLLNLKINNIDFQNGSQMIPLQNFLNRPEH